ncbi:MAG: hypothetical protein IJ170_11135 [Ruminococcus sp.]|nr:hypothetical protein [Ruminococcus sp.]
MDCFCSAIITEVIEALLIAKLEGSTYFSYEVKLLDNATAFMIAERAHINFKNTANNTIFYSEINPLQVERLDCRLNMYTIRYTYSLCEKAALQRVRRCIYEQHHKPPLWAAEALARVVSMVPNSQKDEKGLYLLQQTIERYPEYQYLAAGICSNKLKRNE